MLHKTGSRAVEAEGLTTQQWAVLGALSREKAQAGMSIGELARYLMVSRQNLSGLIGRMERDGHVAIILDDRDRCSRVVSMTPSARHVWETLAQPKIRAYYEQALHGFSVNDMAHALHYLLRIVVPDIAAYDAVYRKLTSQIEIFGVNSSFAMEEIKHTTALPLEYIKTDD